MPYSIQVFGEGRHPAEKRIDIIRLMGRRVEEGGGICGSFSNCSSSSLL